MDWAQFALLASGIVALMAVSGIVGYCLGERRAENASEKRWYASSTYKSLNRKP